MTSFEYEDRLTITTPEGVELSLTLAGVGSRFIAATIDILIEGAVLIAVGVILLLGNGFGAGANTAAAVYAVVAFAIFWGYDVAFEVLASGRTPGKRWNGLRVVLEGGRPVGFRASATRNLLRIVDWLPSGYLVGIISILVSSRNQRLGDLVAGTIVVRELRADKRLPAPLSLDNAEGAVWDLSAVTAEELATVRQFLERRGSIAPDARHELAALIATRLRPKAAGLPDGLGDEAFLERLAAAKSARR